MNKHTINIHAFNHEIGILGYDIDKQLCFFQYAKSFLENGKYDNMFPFIFKKTAEVQVFNQFNNATFKGLPPMIADALPDEFGNKIFKEWFERRGQPTISPLEQLAYVGDRAMGGLSFKPNHLLNENSHLNLNEIVDLLNVILKYKHEAVQEKLDSIAMLNLFKMGTSAGGVRPKIIVSEHKETGLLMPGDLRIDQDYNHYLIKLSLNEQDVYKQQIEYSYYLLAKSLNINMMPSLLMENRHFATLRFDRQDGQRKHVLTATGLTGWDFKLPENSSYENLFKLCHLLKISIKDQHELYRRMLFNVVFANTDDHLKNHSFIYDEKLNNWQLAPAYDLTFALNPFLNFTSISRALSINGKRTNVNKKDVLILAEKFSIDNPTKVIEETISQIEKWQEIANGLGFDKGLINNMLTKFNIL